MSTITGMMHRLISATCKVWARLGNRPIVIPLLCVFILVCHFVFKFNFEDDGLCNINVFIQPTWDGWYRLLKGSFVHSGLPHVFWNVTYITFLGYAVERVLGRLQTLGIILASALGTGLLFVGSDVYYTGHYGGASGIMFGLMATYAVVAAD